MKRNLPETNSQFAPEKLMLGSDDFPFGVYGLFLGAFDVSFWALYISDFMILFYLRRGKYIMPWLRTALREKLPKKEVAPVAIVILGRCTHIFSRICFFICRVHVYI